LDLLGTGYCISTPSPACLRPGFPEDAWSWPWPWFGRSRPSPALRGGPWLLPKSLIGLPDSQMETLPLKIALYFYSSFKHLIGGLDDVSNKAYEDAEAKAK